MGQPQPKMKPDALLVDPDPFTESQLPDRGRRKPARAW